MEIDDAYLGGGRSGGNTGRGSKNKVPFVGAVQTTPDGQPQFVCLRQQPPRPFGWLRQIAKLIKKVLAREELAIGARDEPRELLVTQFVELFGRDRLADFESSCFHCTPVNVEKRPKSTGHPGAGFLPGRSIFMPRGMSDIATP